MWELLQKSKGKLRKKYYYGIGEEINGQRDGVRGGGE